MAITDPEILVRLEQRFSIGVLLAGDATAMNDRVFKDRPLSNIVGALKKDIASLPQMSLDPTARAAFKKPDSGRYRFNSQLNNPKSRFALTGIVNRMDRAYRTVDANKRTYTCGEIRFIYRFSYLVEVPDHPDISSRLPLTMSVVLNAKNKTDSITCADIAARWLKAGRKASREELQAYLLDSGGPLDYLRPSQLDRVEVNIQLFRLPAQIKTDFGGHAEYLLRVFKRETPGASFVATFMENQIDREKLLTDRKLLGSFKQWLLSKSTIWDLDHGLLDVPWIYLATRAISVSPGGASRSQNNPYSGVGITDKEINEALKRYLESGEKLQTIKSPAGFNRRLNDLSCTGCHQTRGIAGFHFPGADLPTEHPRNAVHIPASPHFFGDVPRRRAVIAAFAANKTVDFSRGYSERPDDRFKADLSGTQLFNGWGAVCHLGDDASFLNWTCGSGLECTSLYESPLNPDMGVCVTVKKVGDPLEFGEGHHHGFGNDSYTRTSPPGSTDPNHYVLPTVPPGRNDYATAHQGFKADNNSGGFPAGMLWIASCVNLPSVAACGGVAGNGFNACIAQGTPFPDCLERYTLRAGLRACDRESPCREDYICTAPYRTMTGGRTAGSCIPPYFLFQFRVDGHPSFGAIAEPGHDPTP